jgi:hypothetical protein
MGVGCPSEIMDEALTHSSQMPHRLEIGCQLKSQLKIDQRSAQADTNREGKAHHNFLFGGW